MGVARTRQNDAVASKKDRQHAAELVRRLLAAVDRGEIDAGTPAARRLLRRLEGAAAAWEAESAPFSGRPKAD